jgi:hypothetical protein
MALNMAANEKISEKKRYNVVALASDGSNVRTWMLSFNNMLHMHQLNHLATEHYAMYVRARETMSINIREQVERDILQTRAAQAANDRVAGHTEVKTDGGAATRSKGKKKKKAGAEEEADEDINDQVSAQVSARAQTRRKGEEKRRACALAMALVVEAKEGESKRQKLP